MRLGEKGCGARHELLQQRFAEIVANTSDLDLRMQFVVTPGCGAKPVVHRRTRLSKKYRR